MRKVFVTEKPPLASHQPDPYKQKAVSSRKPLFAYPDDSYSRLLMHIQ